MKIAQIIPFSPVETTQSEAYRTIQVNITKSNHEIIAEFVLRGDTRAIQWPAAAGHTSPGTDLWKHTCFELFISQPGHRDYWEYNFSPSRQWAIYAFQDYRQPAPLAATHTPIIELPHHSDTEFTLQVRFTPESPLINTPLNIGVAAIIETTDGQRHHYALRHCGNKPDFHLRESFLLELD
jgi:hypothetical protein